MNSKKLTSPDQRAIFSALLLAFCIAMPQISTALELATDMPSFDPDNVVNNSVSDQQTLINWSHKLRNALDKKIEQQLIKTLSQTRYERVTGSDCGLIVEFSANKTPVFD